MVQVLSLVLVVQVGDIQCFAVNGLLIQHKHSTLVIYVRRFRVRHSSHPGMVVMV